VGVVSGVIAARVSPSPFLLGLVVFLVTTSFAEALLDARSTRLEGAADA